MKRTALYPFNNDTRVILKNLNLLHELSIETILCSVEEYNYIKRNKVSGDIPVLTDYKKVIDNVDALLFCDNIWELKIEGYKKRLSYAMAKEKDIYLSSILYKQIGKEFFGNYQINLTNPNWIQERYEVGTLFDIRVPVISVMGLGENCDKFSLQIELAKSIKSRGYRALMITSNPLGSIFDMVPLPERMYNSEVSLYEKIIQFNHSLYTLVLKRNPDVIVIGCPSGIMPINRYCSNFYGEIPLVISNAVSIDISILCLYYMSNIQPDTYEELLKYCQFKLNVSSVNFCISRQACGINYERKFIEYRFLEETYINENYNGVETSCYKVSLYQDNAKRKKMIENILEDLEESAVVI